MQAGTRHGVFGDDRLRGRYRDFNFGNKGEKRMKKRKGFVTRDKNFQTCKIHTQILGGECMHAKCAINKSF